VICARCVDEPGRRGGGYRCIVSRALSVWCFTRTKNINYFPPPNPSRFVASHHFTIVYTTDDILNLDRPKII